MSVIIAEPEPRYTLGGDGTELLNSSTSLADYDDALFANHLEDPTAALAGLELPQGMVSTRSRPARAWSL